MYKLVIIDIDGTLINDKRKLTRRTKKVIKKAMSLGVNIAISTGRNNLMTNKVLKKFDHSLVYACGGGAHIYDHERKYIYDGSMTKDEVHEILEVIKDRDCIYQVSCEEAYYKHTSSMKAREYDFYGHNSIKQKVINKYVGMFHIERYEDLYDKFEYASEVVVAGHKEELEAIKEVVAKHHEDLQVRDDLWENYIFIGKKNNSKSDAMSTLCEYFNVDVSEVIAIGDDCNDIDMIRDAGLGVAMGNAIQAVKDAADDITCTNKENGVAKVIEHYILNENINKIYCD